MSCFCDREARIAKQRSEQIDLQLKEERKRRVNTHTLLLIDSTESDNSRVFKQLKIQHGNGFSNEERLQYVSDIRANIKEAIETVISKMDTVEPPMTIADPENLHRLQYIRDEILVLPDFQTNFPPVFYEHFDALWQDSGVQQSLARSNEYQLIENAEYFMEHSKLLEIAKENYLPSDHDILIVRRRSQIFYKITLVIEKIHFHILDIGIHDRCNRFFQCFSDVPAIIFVVACSNYNLKIRDGSEMNQIRASLALFERIWNHRWLRMVSLILLLDKMDVLKKKVEDNVFPIEDYFPEFSKYRPPQEEVLAEGDGSSSKNHRPTLITNAGESVAVRKAKYFFRDLFLRITEKYNDGSHFCYPHFTNSDDPENIWRIFHSSRDIIQRLLLQKYMLL